MKKNLVLNPKITAMLLASTMAAGNVMPVMAQSETVASVIDAAVTANVASETTTDNIMQVVTTSGAAAVVTEKVITLATGTYEITRLTEMSSSSVQIVVTGDATLIADKLSISTTTMGTPPIKVNSGATLDLQLKQENKIIATGMMNTPAISVENGAELTINAHEDDSAASLIASAAGANSPAIGGTSGSGTINIGSGEVTATSGSAAPAIGTITTKTVGPITISGGEVYANGGAGAAAIGGVKGSFADITISGGYVQTNAPSNGISIGATTPSGTGNTITISGGFIDAAAAIGSSSDAAGTGVAVTTAAGAFVRATAINAASIDGKTTVQNATYIKTGTSNGNGVISEDYKLDRNLTIGAGEELEVDADATLTIPSGVTLRIEGTFNVAEDGTVEIEEGGKLEVIGGSAAVDVKGTVNCEGQIVIDDAGGSEFKTTGNHGIVNVGDTGKVTGTITADGENPFAQVSGLTTTTIAEGKDVDAAEESDTVFFSETITYKMAFDKSANSLIKPMSLGLDETNSANEETVDIYLNGELLEENIEVADPEGDDATKPSIATVEIEITEDNKFVLSDEDATLFKNELTIHFGGNNYYTAGIFTDYLMVRPKELDAKVAVTNEDANETETVPYFDFKWEGSNVYNLGEPLTPTLTSVTKYGENGEELTLNTDYTVDAVKLADEATTWTVGNDMIITVTGIGMYTGTYDVVIPIVAADGDFSVAITDKENAEITSAIGFGTEVNITATLKAEETATGASLVAVNGSEPTYDAVTFYALNAAGTTSYGTGEGAGIANVATESDILLTEIVDMKFETGTGVGTATLNTKVLPTGTTTVIAVYEDVEDSNDGLDGAYGANGAEAVLTLTGGAVTGLDLTGTALSLGAVSTENYTAVEGSENTFYFTGTDAVESMPVVIKSTGETIDYTDILLGAAETDDSAAIDPSVEVTWYYVENPYANYEDDESDFTETTDLTKAGVYHAVVTPLGSVANATNKISGAGFKVINKATEISLTVNDTDFTEGNIVTHSGAINLTLNLIDDAAVASVMSITDLSGESFSSGDVHYFWGDESLLAAKVEELYENGYDNGQFGANLSDSGYIAIKDANGDNLVGTANVIANGLVSYTDAFDSVNSDNGVTPNKNDNGNFTAYISAVYLDDSDTGKPQVISFEVTVAPENLNGENITNTSDFTDEENSMIELSRTGSTMEGDFAAKFSLTYGDAESGVKLVKDTDYAVTYRNNTTGYLVAAGSLINSGSYTLIATGMDGYFGTVEQGIKISKPALALIENENFAGTAEASIGEFDLTSDIPFAIENNSDTGIGSAGTFDIVPVIRTDEDGETADEKLTNYEVTGLVYDTSNVNAPALSGTGANAMSLPTGTTGLLVTFNPDTVYGSDYAAPEPLYVAFDNALEALDSDTVGSAWVEDTLVVNTAGDSYDWTVSLNSTYDTFATSAQIETDVLYHVYTSEDYNGSDATTYLAGLEDDAWATYDDDARISRGFTADEVGESIFVALKLAETKFTAETEAAVAQTTTNTTLAAATGAPGVKASNEYPVDSGGTNIINIASNSSITYDSANANSLINASSGNDFSTIGTIHVYASEDELTINTVGDLTADDSEAIKVGTITAKDGTITISDIQSGFAEETTLSNLYIYTYVTFEDQDSDGSLDYINSKIATTQFAVQQAITLVGTHDEDGELNSEGVNLELTVSAIDEYTNDLSTVEFTLAYNPDDDENGTNNVDLTEGSDYTAEWTSTYVEPTEENVGGWKYVLEVTPTGIYANTPAYFVYNLSLPEYDITPDTDVEGAELAAYVSKVEGTEYDSGNKATATYGNEITFTINVPDQYAYEQEDGTLTTASIAVFGASMIDDGAPTLNANSFYMFDGDLSDYANYNAVKSAYKDETLEAISDAVKVTYENDSEGNTVYTEMKDVVISTSKLNSDAMHTSDNRPVSFVFTGGPSLAPFIYTVDNTTDLVTITGLNLADLEDTDVAYSHKLNGKEETTAKFNYTGATVTPTVASVSLNGTELEDDDYSIECASPPTNVTNGTPVTITIIAATNSNYIGEKDFRFEIVKGELQFEDPEVANSGDFAEGESFDTTDKVLTLNNGSETEVTVEANLLDMEGAKVAYDSDDLGEIFLKARKVGETTDDAFVEIAAGCGDDSTGALDLDFSELSSGEWDIYVSSTETTNANLVSGEEAKLPFTVKINTLKFTATNITMEEGLAGFNTPTYLVDPNGVNPYIITIGSGDGERVLKLNADYTVKYIDTTFSNLENDGKTAGTFMALINGIGDFDGVSNISAQTFTVVKYETSKDPVEDSYNLEPTIFVNGTMSNGEFTSAEELNFEFFIEGNVPTPLSLIPEEGYVNYVASYKGEEYEIGEAKLSDEEIFISGGLVSATGLEILEGLNISDEDLAEGGDFEIKVVANFGGTALLDSLDAAAEYTLTISHTPTTDEDGDVEVEKTEYTITLDKGKYAEGETPVVTVKDAKGNVLNELLVVVGPGIYEGQIMITVFGTDEDTELFFNDADAPLGTTATTVDGKAALKVTIEYTIEVVKENPSMAFLTGSSATLASDATSLIAIKTSLPNGNSFVGGTDEFTITTSINRSADSGGGSDSDEYEVINASGTTLLRYTPTDLYDDATTGDVITITITYNANGKNVKVNESSLVYTITVS